VYGYGVVRFVIGWMSMSGEDGGVEEGPEAEGELGEGYV
jgi:hypothetical protein